MVVGGSFLSVLYSAGLGMIYSGCKGIVENGPWILLGFGPTSLRSEIDKNRPTTNRVKVSFLGTVDRKSSVGFFRRAQINRREFPCRDLDLCS
jgi:hypothetical protein